LVGAGDQPFPSVDVLQPVDEGGPIARAGFDYQDEIAVGFVLDMLADPSMLTVRCETHDDVVLVFEFQHDNRLAEYVQVKAGEPDKLWSVAGLCKRDGGAAGTSIFEKSFARDACAEVSRFRIVTLRPVVSKLQVLTYPIGSAGRAPHEDAVAVLQRELDRRFPNLQSAKDNGTEYWVRNCEWCVGESLEAVRNVNRLKLIKQSVADGQPVLPEFADVLLDELRTKVKAAGVARWMPNPNEKVITRAEISQWWKRRLCELAEGAGQVSGGKLRQKLIDANLGELVDLATDLRREYSATLRTPSYMPDDDRSRLQRRVKAEMLILRSGLMAGTVDLDGPAFHALCLARLEDIKVEIGAGKVDLTAFLQGCMYDITDRCLHRFARAV
jgi:hypothetical protein